MIGGFHSYGPSLMYAWGSLGEPNNHTSGGPGLMFLYTACGHLLSISSSTRTCDNILLHAFPEYPSANGTDIKRVVI